MHKIVHVVGFVQAMRNTRLSVIQDRLWESADRAENSNLVWRVACASCEMQYPGWESVVLFRDAKTELGHDRDLPFLRDLLNIAYYRLVDYNDWILYTNLDCVVSPWIYSNLMDSDADCIEYMRLNTSSASGSLTEIYESDSQLFATGVDGFAMRGQFFKAIEPILEDYLLAAFAWDDVLSGMVRSINKIVPDDSFRVDSQENDLFHPFHAENRVPGKPTYVELYNRQFCGEARASGLIDCDYHITPRYKPSKTAVVVAVFGQVNELREAALRKATKQWRIQTLPHDLLLVYLSDGASKHRFDDLGADEIIWLEETELNFGLWQKEALFNVGGSVASSRYENLIFADGDIYSPRSDWFYRMTRLLDKNPNMLVHGLGTCEDEKDSRHKTLSLAASHCLGLDCPEPYMIGGVWGMSSSFFSESNGWNPFCLDGSGDQMLYYEYLNSSSCMYIDIHSEHEWFNEIIRNGISAELGAVDDSVVHCYHGCISDRDYSTPTELLGRLSRSIRDVVRLDSRGLLEWVDPASEDRKYIEKKTEITR